MSASEWIQLFIHPEDAEIQRLAELTGRSPEVCFAAVIRWFWHVDRKCDSPQAGIGDAGFHKITRWQDNRKGKATLARAMRDEHVGWLEGNANGTLVIPKFEQHFGRNAKRRAKEAQRKMSARYADKGRTGCGQDADENRTDCAPTTTTTTTGQLQDNRPGPVRSRNKNRSGRGECEGGAGPGRDLDLDSTGPGRGAKTIDRFKRQINADVILDQIELPGNEAAAPKSVDSAEPERWVQFFIIKLCLAFGFEDDSAVAQRRAFRRVAGRLLKTANPNGLARQLVDLAVEKQNASPRLDRPVAVWQAAVNKILESAGV